MVGAATGCQINSQFYERMALSKNKAMLNKVLAAEYRTALPDEELLAAEIDRARDALRRRSLPPTEADMG